MALYEIATRTVTVAAASAALEIIAGAADRAKIMEIGVFMAAATASVFGLGRPGAIGVTPTSPIIVLPEEPGDAVGTSKVATAWGTPPTVPTNFLRRIALPAAIGNGIIWTFPQGIRLAAAASLVLWNIGPGGANGVADVYVVIDE